MDAEIEKTVIHLSLTILFTYMATVSARVPDDLKKQVSEENISLSKVIREALEEELKRQRRRNIKADAEKLSEEINLDDSGEEIAEDIREDRQR